MIRWFQFILLLLNVIFILLLKSFYIFFQWFLQLLLFLFFCHFLSPITPMSFSLHIILRQSIESESLNEEVPFSLDDCHNIQMIIITVFEQLSWFVIMEVFNPTVNHLINCLFLHLFVFLFTSYYSFQLCLYVYFLLYTILLKTYSLSSHHTFHSLLF